MNNIDSIHSQSPSNPATTTCPHCEGFTEHQHWCITLDPKVQYAYAIVNDPFALTYRDSLILHSLGVAWRDKDR